MTRTKPLVLLGILRARESVFSNPIYATRDVVRLRDPPLPRRLSPPGNLPYEHLALLGNWPYVLVDMAWDEYREALQKLGLTQEAGAELVGVDERTSRRWASGTSSVPEPVARFLRYLIVTKKTGAQAMRILGT